MYLELANFESSNQIAERVDPYFPYCHQLWQYSLPLAYVKSVISLDNRVYAPWKQGFEINLTHTSLLPLPTIQEAAVT